MHLVTGVDPAPHIPRLLAMGDKSPKANQKQAGQKQAKGNTAKQKKDSAAAAKQVPKTKK